MIKNVWFYLLSVLKALFTTPEYTKLEQELIRRIEFLEIELSKERERYDRAITTFNTGPVHQSPIQTPEPIPGIPTWNDRKKQLEQLSVERLRKSKQIEEMERHAKQMESEIAARGGTSSPELKILTDSDGSKP